MSKFVLLSGLPASGKTTLRKLLKQSIEFSIISTDDFIEDKAKSLGKTYNQIFKETYSEAEEYTKELLNNNLAICQNILWDATNMTNKSRARKLANFDNTYDKYCILIDPYYVSTLEIALQRNNERDVGRKIPEKVIREMYNYYDPPKESEGFHNIFTLLPNFDMHDIADIVSIIKDTSYNYENC